MKFDIVIVGGGLVGASLTAALKNSRLSLALVESHAASKHPVERVQQDDQEDVWDSRIYAISPGSRRFLEESGAWLSLDARRIAPVGKMRVFGDTGAQLEFSAYQMGVAELACILEGSALQQALWHVLEKQENLTLFRPARCARLNFADTAATLTLEDGRTLEAKLIVGADGRDSWVRDQAGISAAPVDYRQSGVVANFACELPHRGIAHQWFQADGILALLPLPGNRVSMVWSVSPEQSAELSALTHEALSGKVSAAAHHMLGEMRVITPAASFPLRMLVLSRVTAPRLALMGDAAHNMHPLAGQGVNTGFRDARQLSRILAERGAQNDCGDARLLRRYERKRKEDIYSMQATTYGLKQLFNNDVPPLRVMRNFGLAATNHLTPLKKLLMQHALS